MTRQQKYQLRNKSKGLCTKCPRPLETKTLCKKHNKLRNKLYRDKMEKMTEYCPKCGQLTEVKYGRYVTHSLNPTRMVCNRSGTYSMNTLVDQWYQGTHPESLAEYLGMTEAQYKDWVVLGPEKYFEKQREVYNRM